ncbi:FecR family protein [Rudanella lutea]|uniref:FecR family protein n=1 Tax=Rudanella lutea TaxID=451374 RepID=UPI000377A705|nr:FecR family protein [Rudanella lutea]
MKPYATYAAEELALDDMFMRWVQHPDDDEVALFWQTFTKQHPHRRAIVEEARRMVIDCSTPLPGAMANDEMANLWERIRGSLRELDEVKPLQPSIQKVVTWWYFGRTVAAALGLLLFIGWSYWIHRSDKLQTIRSGSAQTRMVRLPDGSKARLQPNSQLEFVQQWVGEIPRAVWLQGEARFSVVHSPKTSTFRVHTSDVTVEATGTEFWIGQQAEGTRIGLQRGTLTLLLNDDDRRVTMHPGDSLEVRGHLVFPLKLSVGQLNKAVKR